MRVETERLLLRSVEVSDAAALAALWSDAEVTRFMGGPRDFENVRRMTEDEVRAGSPQPIGFWPVIEKASDRVIGHCGLVRKEVDGQVETELVYVFAVTAWGRGYATEAASALRDHAFQGLTLPRIISLIDPENSASARVAQKVGLRFEKETLRPTGKVMCVYAMQNPDDEAE